MGQWNMVYGLWKKPINHNHIPSTNKKAPQLRGFFIEKKCLIRK
jgi:hypothetical protein